ncbi:hypothetical protein, partial [Acinetobacter baumannii]|uniref:hypothetical protein n=1 Tax=Acinetobacter baumannii TaxID=470 RepID=UPI001C094E87
MPEFAADLLSGVLVNCSLACAEQGLSWPTRRRSFPACECLIPHLRVPMPQSVHVAQTRRLA